MFQVYCVSEFNASTFGKDDRVSSSPEIKNRSGSDHHYSKIVKNKNWLCSKCRNFRFKEMKKIARRLLKAKNRYVKHQIKHCVGKRKHPTVATNSGMSSTAAQVTAIIKVINSAAPLTMATANATAFSNFSSAVANTVSNVHQ